MKITTTDPDGTVTEQTVDVPLAAKTIRVLWKAEQLLRDELAAAGVHPDIANEIAIAGAFGARAAAGVAGLLPELRPSQEKE